MPGAFQAGGSMFINSRYKNVWETLDYKPGGVGFGNLLHEWGHMLGLEHVDHGKWQVAREQNHRGFSVMSHAEDPTGRAPSAFTPIDLAGLRYVYGTPEERAALGVTRQQWVREDGSRDGLITIAGDSGGPVGGLKTGSDLMVGGRSNDGLFGLGGDDILIGRGGSDYLRGGDGQDLVGLPGVTLADLQVGAARFLAWRSSVDGKEWSGIVQRKDGGVDIFENMEGLALSDATFWFQPHGTSTTAEIAARVVTMMTGQGASSSLVVDHAIPNLQRGSMSVRDLVEHYLRGSGAGSFPVEVPGGASALQQAWGRLYPEQPLPSALQVWATRAGDLAPVLEAIALAPRQALREFSAFVPELHLQAPPVDMTLRSPVSPDAALQKIFQVILDRAPTEQELALYVPALRHDGVSIGKIAADLLRGAEFSGALRSGSTSVHEFLGVQPNAGGASLAPLSMLQARALGDQIAQQLGLDPVAPENLLLRNGALGFTLKTQNAPHDLVSAYLSSWEIQDIWLRSDSFTLVQTVRGQEVLLPSTVRTIELLDGSLTLSRSMNSPDFDTEWTQDPHKLWTIRLYEGVLGRLPDSFVLADLLRAGTVSVHQMISEMVRSPEFKFLKSAHTPEQFVGLAYRQALNREATPAEEAAWAQALRGGVGLDSLFIAVITSSEAQQLYSAKAPAFLGIGTHAIIFDPKLRQLGSSEFGHWEGWASNTNTPRHLADVNGDGHLDLVGFGNGVRVALGDGTGNFAKARTVSQDFGHWSGWNSNETVMRVLGDVNGDGAADIVGFGKGVWVSFSLGSASIMTEVVNANGSLRQLKLVTPGHDVLAGSDGNDTLTGGGGNDTLTGGAGADHFFVDVGTDTVTDLGLGNDELTISAGATAHVTLAGDFRATALTSNAGVAHLSAQGFNADLSTATGPNGWVITNADQAKAVTLRGSARSDVLTGGNGRDTLIGGDGNDTLTGGGGNDRLEGGAGADILSGGAGRDAFVFRSYGDSASGTEDLVVDFWVRHDWIDARAIDTFLFVGTGAFAGGGQASIRYAFANGETQVQFDSGNGGAAEMVVRLSGQIALASENFLL
jgi:Ca2+-binding RTX toxin-like protein